jgi:uncharacterized coiled-coil protein SlyX
MITLQDDAADYVLTIPYYQRDRAKAIDGRRWDANLRCWRYPKTIETYNALIAEFGDELYGAVPAPPGQASPPLPDLPYLLDSNQELRQQLEDVQNTLRALATSTAQQAGHHDRGAELEMLAAQQAATISELRSANSALQQEVAAITNDRDEVRTRFRSLEKRVSELQRATTEPSFPRKLAEIAALASGTDERFAKLLAKSEMTPFVAIELTKALERTLRELLGADQGTSLYDLIYRAREASILTQDAANYAHTLRTARNVIAHLEPQDSTTQARTLMCIFAAALLWRELPKTVTGTPNP